MSDDEHKPKDPSLLTFEGPYMRRCILASYLVLVILALPLWWSTTSIQRLSLPKAHIDSLAAKEVRR
jgi:GPI-anchor transamidase subunit S